MGPGYSVFFLCSDSTNWLPGRPGRPEIGVGPPLSKKLFPVSRVGKKRASREVGNLFFFFLISFFIN